MFCISSLDKNERSRATRSTRGGHLWRRLYFKIRGFKIDKTGRVGNKGESVAAVQRRWLTVVIVPLLIIQARGAMISRFFTRCNRNRLKNREGGREKKKGEGNLRRGIRKYERARGMEADVALEGQGKPLFCFNGAVSLALRSNFSMASRNKPNRVSHTLFMRNLFTKLNQMDRRMD